MDSADLRLYLQPNKTTIYREVSEWLKEHAWKVCIRETVSRVRIPSSLQQDERKKPDEVRFFYAQKRVQTLVSERAAGHKKPGHCVPGFSRSHLIATPTRGSAKLIAGHSCEYPKGRSANPFLAELTKRQRN